MCHTLIQIFFLHYFTYFFPDIKHVDLITYLMARENNAIGHDICDPDLEEEQQQNYSHRKN